MAMLVGFIPKGYSDEQKARFIRECEKCETLGLKLAPVQPFKNLNLVRTIFMIHSCIIHGFFVHSTPLSDKSEF